MRALGKPRVAYSHRVRFIGFACLNYGWVPGLSISVLGLEQLRCEDAGVEVLLGVRVSGLCTVRV